MERERKRELQALLYADRVTDTGPDFAKLAGAELVDELDAVARNFQVLERDELGLLGTRRHQLTAQTVIVLCRNTRQRHVRPR